MSRIGRKTPLPRRAGVQPFQSRVHRLDQREGFRGNVFKRNPLIHRVHVDARSRVGSAQQRLKSSTGRGEGDQGGCSENRQEVDQIVARIIAEEIIKIAEMKLIALGHDNHAAKRRICLGQGAAQTTVRRSIHGEVHGESLDAAHEVEPGDQIFGGSGES